MHIDDGVDDASVTNMPTNPQGYFFGSYTTAAAPSREGYDFQGMKAEGTVNVYEANQGFTLNGDVTLGCTVDTEQRKCNLYD